MDGIIKHKKTRNLRFNKVSRLSSAMRKKRLELSQDIKNTVRKGRSAHHLSLGNQKGNQNTLRGIYILLSNYKYTYLKMCSSLTPLLIFCCRTYFRTRYRTICISALDKHIIYTLVMGRQYEGS